jgi:hypothetical protein
MHTQTHQLILASIVALAAIGGTAYAQVTVAPSTPIAPNTAPTVNAAPNVAPTVAPTTTVSPTVAAPVLPATCSPVGKNLPNLPPCAK